MTPAEKSRQRGDRWLAEIDGALEEHGAELSEKTIAELAEARRKRKEQR